MANLVELLKKADQAAFKEVYQTYHHKVFRFAMNYVKDEEYAREITQQVFIRIWDKRAKLSEKKPLEAQIFTISKNLIIDNLRKQARTKTFEANYLLSLPSKDLQTESSITLSEYQQQVAKIIDEMPSKRKMIFKMNKLEGMSMDEIAKTMSISPKTVDSHLQLATKYIRKKLATILRIFF